MSDETWLVDQPSRVFTNPGLPAAGVTVRKSRDEWMAGTDRRPDGTLVYPGHGGYLEQLQREESSRSAWEHRLRIWLASAVSWASAGMPWVTPPAPDGTPSDWRWTNWQAYTEEEALNVALVRTYGCRCHLPLLGWTMKHDGVDGWGPTTPRCRTCNAEAPDG